MQRGETAKKQEAIQNVTFPPILKAYVTTIN